MAISNLPPWLNIGPTDYLQAIQAGTQAGLEVSRQRVAMQEAAARRALAEQESQRSAWEFGENLRQRAALAAAENEQQREYQTGMLDWRREQMRMDAEKAAAGDLEAQARIKETMRHNLATEALSKAENERSVIPTEWGRDPNKAYITRGGAYVAPTESTLDPVAKALLASESKRLQAIDKELFDLTGGVEPTVGWMGWGSGKKEQYDALMNQRNQIRNAIQQFGKPGASSIPAISESPSLGSLDVGSFDTSSFPSVSMGQAGIPPLAPMGFNPSLAPSAGTTESETESVESAPPVSERVSGKVYLTPKGQFKWTGTGWVKP